MSAPSYRRLSRADSGFTLVELMIAVAIIGILAYIFIPLFLASMHVARQRRAMADINTIGKAMMSQITDQLGAAAAGATTVNMDDYGAATPAATLSALLVPTYLGTVPARDPWGNVYDYRIQTVNLSANQLAALRTPARDGVFSGDTYSVGGFPVRSYNEDIVWADGIFVRWPEGK